MWLTLSGDSNIIDGIMLEDKLVEILGHKFECVDVGFGTNRPVDVVIRPEDVILGKEGEGDAGWRCHLPDL